jgi:ABC-type ATPase with predicted acetyltransferase domain
VVCWQATDKALEIAVCSVERPVGRYRLPARAAFYKKDFWELLKKLKHEIPLFFSMKKTATRWF